MLLVLRQNFETSPVFLLSAYVLSMGLPILAFDLFVTRPKGFKLNFNFSSRSPITYILVLMMMIGMMLISEFLTSFIPTTGPVFGGLYEFFSKQMESIALDGFLLVIMVAVLAPIFEEILFRGIILKGMLNRGVEPMKAIIFSSLIFGIIHGNPWQFLGAFLLGLVLGFVYYKTRSLLLPILLHAFNNFFAAMMLIYIKKESIAEVFQTKEIYLFGIGILIFSIGYYLFMKKYPTEKGIEQSI